MLAVVVAVVYDFSIGVVGGNKYWQSRSSKGGNPFGSRITKKVNFQTIPVKKGLTNR
jgi:hypothetical protein